VRERADGWIGWTTTGCVALLAVIAGTVSYLHMHQLVAGHGQPGWVPALTPLSVDSMIVAASTALLADSRSGGRRGLLPWRLLVTGSVASLAANVAVAEPTATRAGDRRVAIVRADRLLRATHAPDPQRRRQRPGGQASRAESQYGRGRHLRKAAVILLAGPRCSRRDRFPGWGKPGVAAAGLAVGAGQPGR
jgi:hypothetical protein